MRNGRKKRKGPTLQEKVVWYMEKTRNEQ